MWLSHDCPVYLIMLPFYVFVGSQSEVVSPKLGHFPFSSGHTSGVQGFLRQSRLPCLLPLTPLGTVSVSLPTSGRLFGFIWSCLAPRGLGGVTRGSAWGCAVADQCFFSGLRGWQEVFEVMGFFCRNPGLLPGTTRSLSTAPRPSHMCSKNSLWASTHATTVRALAVREPFLH